MVEPPNEWLTLGESTTLPSESPLSVVQLPDGRLLASQMHEGIETLNPVSSALTMWFIDGDTIERNYIKLAQDDQISFQFNGGLATTVRHLAWWDHEADELAIVVHGLSIGLFHIIENTAVPFRVAGTAAVALQDSFLWHNRLKRLVHVHSPQDHREPVRVNILDEQEWKPFGAAVPQTGRNGLMIAGWDPAGQRLVVATDGGCYVIGEDGHDTTSIGSIERRTVNSWSVAVASEGRLLLFGRPMHEQKVLSFELIGDDWEMHETSLAPVLQRSAAALADGDCTLVAQRPEISRPRSLFVKYVAGTAVGEGPIEPPRKVLVSSSNRLIAWENTTFGSTVLAEFDRHQGRWTALAGSSTITLAAFFDGDELMRIEGDGSIHVLGSDTSWHLLVAPPESFEPRSAAGASWSPSQRALHVYGGNPDDYFAEGKRRYLGDVRRWSPEDGWTMFTGINPPLLTHSTVGFDPVRGALVVAGGKSRDDDLGFGTWNRSSVYEAVDGTWFRFPAYFEAHGDTVSDYPFTDSMMHWDEEIKMLVLVGTSGAWVYQGRGTFRSVRVESGALHAAGYDVTKRTMAALVRAADELLVERDIGSLVEEAAARAPITQLTHPRANSETDTAKPKRPVDPARWWRLGSTGRDFVGGANPLDGPGGDPTCRHCHSLMAHVVTLGSGRSLLRLSDTVVSVYLCTSEEDCGSFELDDIATRVIVSEARLSTLRKRADNATAAPHLDFKRISYKRGPGESTTTNHTGGEPRWYQGATVPTCGDCAQSMDFLAQFDEFDQLLNFGGDGTMYVFLCPDSHEGTAFWQSG